MKCPKCQYISFDQGDRCRNCGYEFSLSVDMTDLDLPIKTGDEAVGPFSDFSLSDIDELPAPAPGSAQPSRAAANLRSPDLPLFGLREQDDDAPLVSLPASPRPPVSVRKSTVTRGPQQPPAPDEPALDLGSPPDFTPRADEESRSAWPPAAPEIATGEGERNASAVRRVLAATLDLALLAAIDAGVLYSTLRLVGLEFAEAAQVPVVPFVAFLALLNGGYMAVFTAAGGQSIGKMVMGIKVVTIDESRGSDRVPLGQAVLRAAGYLVSALPAGLGFLPALFGPERRAVHDRLAHTRVVKA
jgi:uncharacterized RDD family membrane protein YckC